MPAKKRPPSRRGSPPWLAIGAAVVFLGVGVTGAVRAFAPDELAAPDPSLISPPPKSSPTPKPRLEPLPVPQGPPPQPVSYASIEALAQALANRGLTCTDLNDLPQPNATLKQFALCDMGSPNRRVNIWLYETPTLRRAWVGQMLGAIDLVHGANWIVTPAGESSTRLKRARLVSLAIGGEVVPAQK